MSPRAASLVVRRLVAPPAARLFRLPARGPPVVARRFVRPGPLSFARWFVGPGSLALARRFVLPGLVAAWFAAPGPLSFAGRFVRPRSLALARRLSRPPSFGSTVARAIPAAARRRRPRRRSAGGRPIAGVRIALGRRVPFGALLALLPPPRFLVESRARILVLAAGPPVAAALLARELRPAPRGVLRLRRFPQPPLREPLQLDALVRAPQLRERRHELLLLARAERRRLVVNQNRPVREARRHISGASRPASIVGRVR